MMMDRQVASKKLKVHEEDNVEAKIFSLLTQICSFNAYAIKSGRGK